MQTDDGRLVVIAGASRTGKTAYTAQQVGCEKRIIAYDPEDQWSQLRGWRRITADAELLRAVNSGDPARLAFVPSGDLQKKFNLWAGCAFYWGRYFGGCVAIAEEIADVTSPAKAPGNWGILLRRGLKRNITIYAISQRWSEADKTAFGNASEFVVFRQSSAQDIDYLARRTRLEVEQIAALQNLQYVKLDASSGKSQAGKVTFSKKR